MYNFAALLNTPATPEPYLCVNCDQTLSLIPPPADHCPLCNARGSLYEQRRVHRRSSIDFPNTKYNITGGELITFTPELCDYRAGARPFPNIHHASCASMKSVDALQIVEITCQLIDSSGDVCSVCWDDFEIGSKATQMPCSHIFHRRCILPWLYMSNSCPVCLFELPLEGEDEEDED